MIWLIILGAILALVVAFWLIGQVIGFILMLALAGIIGAAIGSLLNYRGGILFSIGAGLAGAVIGTVIANLLGMPKFLTLWNLPILWTVVGAAAVVAAAKVVMPGDRRRLGGGSRELLR
jgi:uncharacterized membrane protein YeaQ/YmgE (transglycosylase-associated protein family)